MRSNGWFTVDKEGLAKLVERRGKGFILFELLQNAWDCDGTKHVEVSLVEVPGRPLAHLVVIDDHPDGFKDLSHAYTLFAESEKKVSTRKRGRFNFGEKLVLSLCESAVITSTKGKVVFDSDGRHESKHKRPAGTCFEAHVRMTRGELADILEEAKKLIPSVGVETKINGVLLETRRAAKTVRDVLLMTEVADAGGVVRRRHIETSVEIYVPHQGEKAMLYEMGIPVVELSDDPYHVNVMQKVPLSMERDSVPPSYLRDVRSTVLDHMHGMISEEQARGKWAVEAVEGSMNPDAVKAVVVKRFGERNVILDPSDREANNIAVAQGYTTIPGGAFTADAWDKIREFNVSLPAGRVTPSPKPFSENGEPLKLLDPSDCDANMDRFADMAVTLADRAAGLTVTVVFANDSGWPFRAAYSGVKDGKVGRVIFNVAKLGRKWFISSELPNQLQLIIHELAHQWGHHLESSYHEATCEIGSNLAMLALKEPTLFRW
jgi:hypothetical protein